MRNYHKETVTYLVIITECSVKFPVYSLHGHELIMLITSFKVRVGICSITDSLLLFRSRFFPGFIFERTINVSLFIFFRLLDKTEKSTGVLKWPRTYMCYWNIQEGYTKKISNKLYSHWHRNHLNGKPREDIRFSWTSRKTTSASLWRKVRILAFCFLHKRG